MKKYSYPSYGEYLQRVAQPAVASGGYRKNNQAFLRGSGPLVSIITVTYNAGRGLLRALQSVRDQTYANREHIVIDGGSTDGTVQLIRQHEDSIAVWRSEPDKGIYDAFNKGIALAAGEFIGILNADDYYEPDQIEHAVAALLRTGAPFVHGDIILHGWQGQDVFLPGDPNYAQVIRERMPMLHQVTTVCRREVFEKYGMFSLLYRIAGDFDWYLRLANRGCIGHYESRIKAHMTAGGVSTTRQRRSVWEGMMITWRHGLPLHRVMRSWAPRFLYPNGAPPFLKRLIRGLKNPGDVVSFLKRRLGAGLGRIRRLFPVKGTTQPLLAAFVSARQRSLTLDPLALEWIYGAGLRARTFTVRTAEADAPVVRQMLESGGAVYCGEIARADIIVLDRSHAADMDIARLVMEKTVLITSSPDWSPRSEYPFAALEFGGISAFGKLIEPQATLRWRLW